MSRGVVQRRMRAFYENARGVAEEFPDATHGFECTWNHVFGVPALPPELQSLPLPIYRKPIRRLMPGDGS